MSAAALLAQLDVDAALGTQPLEGTEQMLNIGIGISIHQNVPNTPYVFKWGVDDNGARESEAGECALEDFHRTHSPWDERK
jgi:hypothetical protein